MDNQETEAEVGKCGRAKEERLTARPEGGEAEWVEASQHGDAITSKTKG